MPFISLGKLTGKKLDRTTTLRRERKSRRKVNCTWERETRKCDKMTDLFAPNLEHRALSLTGSLLIGSFTQRVFQISYLFCYYFKVTIWAAHLDCTGNRTRDLLVHINKRPTPNFFFNLIKLVKFATKRSRYCKKSPRSNPVKYEQKQHSLLVY